MFATFRRTKPEKFGLIPENADFVREIKKKAIVPNFKIYYNPSMN